MLSFEWHLLPGLDLLGLLSFYNLCPPYVSLKPPLTAMTWVGMNAYFIVEIATIDKVYIWLSISIADPRFSRVMCSFAIYVIKIHLYLCTPGC